MDDPSLWSEHVTAENKTYYYNSETKQSVWDKPDCLKQKKAVKQEKPPGERASDWKEYLTPEGKKYYHNAITSVTTWDKPETMLEAEKMARRNIISGALGTAGGQELERTDRMNIIGREGTLITAAMYAVEQEDAPIFRNTTQAEEAFQKMLKKMNVEADWTWEQAIRACIKEPVWRSLPDTTARKACFEQYMIEVKKATIGKQKNRIEKLKRDFDAMLQRHPEVKPWSQWHNVKEGLEHEAAFRSAIDEEEREALFEIYTDKIKAQHIEDNKRRTEEAARVLADRLKDMNITLNTSWEDAQGLIASDRKIQSDPNVKSLHPFYLLQAFENRQKDLEDEYNENLKLERRQRRRQERKNREAFKELLDSMRQAGSITAMTKWKDIFEVIKDTSEFQAMLDQDGSSPLDFFWDLREKLEEELGTKKASVVELLERTAFKVTTETTLGSFIAHLREHLDSSVDDVALGMIFAQLRQSALKAREEEQRLEERKIKHRQDDLRSAMKKLNPPIGLSDTYESTRPRISMLSEFAALSEADRIAAWEKYMRRLRERIEDDERRYRRRHRSRSRDRRRPVESSLPPPKRNKIEAEVVLDYGAPEDVKAESSEEGEINE